MDFYYGSVSGNSSRVAFALYELGLQYVPHRVDTRAGHNRAPAYLAINPMGKIPALIDGSVRLWESNAINWYLAEKNPRAHLLPTTIEGRASTQRWLFFQTGHVTPACAALFRATNARMQQFWNMRGDQASADAATKELARYLPVLEAALADREWLENEFSLADIAFAPHLWLVAEGGFDFSAYPAVRAWLDRTLARPAWREARHMIFEAQI